MSTKLQRQTHVNQSKFHNRDHESQKILGRSHIDPKKTHMLFQTTIPSQTLNSPQLENTRCCMINPNLHNIFLQTQPNKKQNTNTRREITPQKKQENDLPTQPQISNHTNIKQTTKITGSNNHYSILSLNVIELNSPK